MQIIKGNVANLVSYPAFMSGQTPDTIVGFKTHVNTMAKTGGAYSTWVSDTVIGRMKSQVEEYGLLKKGYHIVLYEDIVGSLTPSQLKAVIGHERAHILLGHIPRVEEPLAEGEIIRAIMNMEHELHADWCSARVNGKEPLREGIVAVLGTTAKIVARVGVLRGKIPPNSETGFASELLERSLSDEVVVTRLKALS